MLYVGCGNCRAIETLICSGRFMPHVPVYVEGGPTGIYCLYCGQLPPIFTCMQCRVTQLAYFSGAALPGQMLPGAPSTVAPVVHASPNASGSELKNLLFSAGKSFLSEFAGHAGGQFGDQFGNWASSWFGDNNFSSQGNGDPWFGGGGQY